MKKSGNLFNLINSHRRRKVTHKAKVKVSKGPANDQLVSAQFYDTGRSIVLDISPDYEESFAQEQGVESAYHPENQDYSAANSLSDELFYESFGMEDTMDQDFELISSEPHVSRQSNHEEHPTLDSIVSDQYSVPTPKEVIIENAKPNEPVKKNNPSQAPEPTVIPESVDSKDSIVREDKDEDDDFINDLKAILNGDKKYDADKKKTVASKSSALSDDENTGKDIDQMKKNEHQIFEKISQSMQYANAYDFGSIALDKKFDAFDEELDGIDKQTSRPANKTYITQHQKEYAPATASHGLSTDSEFIQDLDEIVLGKSIEEEAVKEPVDVKAAAEPAQKLNSFKEPLTPETGGKTIAIDAIKKGDLLINSSNGLAGLNVYLGNNEVAVDGDQLVYQPMAQFSKDHAFAVLRVPLSEEANSALIKGLKPDTRPAKADDSKYLSLTKFHASIASEHCKTFEGAEKSNCQSFNGAIDFGATDNASVRISQTMFEAFGKANISFSTAPDWKSKEALSAALNLNIEYIGHFKKS